MPRPTNDRDEIRAAASAAIELAGDLACYAADLTPLTSEAIEQLLRQARGVARLLREARRKEIETRLSVEDQERCLVGQA